MWFTSRARGRPTHRSRRCQGFLLTLALLCSCQFYAWQHKHGQGQLLIMKVRKSFHFFLFVYFFLHHFNSFYFKLVEMDIYTFSSLSNETCTTSPDLYKSNLNDLSHLVLNCAYTPLLFLKIS